MSRVGARQEGSVERTGIDQGWVAELLSREHTAWIEGRPKGQAHHRRAMRSQIGGTPLRRPREFPPPFPIVVERAEGARLHDTDGHVYADLGLCGTAALWGHTNPSVIGALQAQLGRGIVTDWPNEEHTWVAEELHRRFGLPFWQFTISATDANRFALRLARVATGRQRILVFEGSYHGSVDETFAVLTPTGIMQRPGVAPNAIPISETTKVVEYNDLNALEQALAPGDVAAVIAEPAMTVGGSIMLPQPGFHTGLRELTRNAGTLLIIDETQTIPAGPGGCTREFGLQPDFITMGKCIAGGIPAGLYGMSEEVADAAGRYLEESGGGLGGMGSTLAGGALAVRAMHVVLEEVMTEETYAEMFRLAERYENAVAAIIRAHELPWHVARLGSRVAYAFVPQPPTSARQMRPRVGSELHRALWLYLANRKIAISGWDCTALFSPQTDEADVELHNHLLAEVIGSLVGA